jgi:hypothetical protein
MSLMPVTIIIIATCQIVPAATIVYLYVAIVKLCSSDCYCDMGSILYSAYNVIGPGPVKLGPQKTIVQHIEKIDTPI